VYRDGTGLYKNTVTLSVQDARWFKEHQNGLEHEIWIPNGITKMPSFEAMGTTPITERHQKPVFSCHFISRNKSQIEQPMKVHLLRQSDYSIRFRAEFPFDVKDNDILTYQYLWGTPTAFRVFEEELRSPNDYDEVAIRASHGSIGAAELRVKFERENIQGLTPTLFSKEPFVLFSYSRDEQGMLWEPEPVTRIESDSLYITYERFLDNLDEAMIMRWRPISRAHFERDMSAARFLKIERVPETGQETNVVGEFETESKIR
jgi:hypothetical protein